MLCTEFSNFFTAMTIRHHEELDGLATDVDHGRARPILTLQAVRAGRCIAGAVHFASPSRYLDSARSVVPRLERIHVLMRCIDLVIPNPLIAMSSRRGSTRRGAAVQNRYR